MRKNKDYLLKCGSFEEFFDWALEEFNIISDLGSHFKYSDYINWITDN
jgi:hypothetical protein